MTPEEFVKAHNVTLTTHLVDRRYDRYDDQQRHKLAIHWHITLMIGDRVGWRGYYSHGIGYAEQWITRRPKTVKERNAQHKFKLVHGTKAYPLPWNKRYPDDSDIIRDLRAAYGSAVTPSPAEVIQALQLDAGNSDQSFEDWCYEFGMNPDSIKDKRMWETCNDTRRSLKAAMDPIAWSDFESMQEE